VSEEVSNELNSSVDAWETGKEIQAKTVEKVSCRSANQDSGSEMCDTAREFETNLSMEPNDKLQDDASENADDNEEFQVNNFEKSDIVEKTRTDNDSSDEPNVDNGE